MDRGRMRHEAVIPIVIGLDYESRFLICARGSSVLDFINESAAIYPMPVGITGRHYFKGATVQQAVDFFISCLAESFRIIFYNVP